VCGYIHRMQEKMGENRTYAQFLPNTSRIDYLSAMTYTHGFVGAVERGLKLQVPPRAEYIRVITSEMNRISSHLVWWGAFLLDLGGFTPLLYAFDDREKILDLLEGITGSRLTYSYFRIGGIYNDIDDTFINGTRAFVAQMRPRLKMYRSLVTDNIILRKRLIEIGPISKEMCRKYGATGPVIRGSGVPYDVRKVEVLYSAAVEQAFEKRVSQLDIRSRSDSFVPSWLQDGDYELRHFSIARDRTHLLPYVREALARNPELRLFASPWSPPTWMKYPKAFNYGTLIRTKENLAAYALYLSKFVQASTTMTRLLLPVMLNPNRFVRTPKLAPRVCACGFHSTAGRPPNGECQFVIPGK